MTGKYEIHITRTVPSVLVGWKNSLIETAAGDRHYLTSYASTEERAREKLADAMKALRSDDGRTTRAKIELIVLDIRFVEETERA